VAGELAIEVRQLVKRFGGRVTAVDRLDLSVAYGETYGLLGPNGAGKTRPMLASCRAELLILRKSRVAWALVLTAPLLTLVTTYLFQFLDYLGLTPAMYAHFGTPAQNLPALLPSQFVIQTVNDVGFTAPFIVLSAVIAGGDWGRGTIKTSLLQGPTRARTCIGQALAIAVALLVSVAMTFVVSGLFSMVIAVTQTGPVALVPSPPLMAGRLAAGFGIAVVVSLAWGAAGWTAGTLLKSATGAFAAMLLWVTIVQLQLDQFATELSGPLRTIYDLLPDASTNTVTNLFGAANPQYAPTFGEVAPRLAFAILALYALACFVFPVIATRRRDIL